MYSRVKGTSVSLRPSRPYQPARSLTRVKSCQVLIHTPPLAFCCNCLQVDISSLTVAVHDPMDADYILTAVLLASLLGGSSTAIQEWSDGFKEGVPTTLPIDCNSEIFS